MKKFALAILPIAMLAVACDEGPNEEIGEELDDVAEAQAEVMDERAEALEAMADETADPGETADLEAQAENLEDAADEI